MSAGAAQALFAVFLTDVERRGEMSAASSLLGNPARQLLDENASAGLAESLLRAGYAATALALLDETIPRYPDTMELRYQRGNALRVTGRLHEAEMELQAVLKSDPAHRDAAYSLAHLLREQARIHAAAEVMTAVANARRDDRNVTVAALRFLEECAAHSQAAEIAERAAATWPQDAELQSLAGTLQLALGAFGSARDHFRKSLDLDPGQSAAWLRLAQCQRYERLDDDDIRRYRQAWTSTELPGAARTCAAFALGKALDDLGEFAEAAQFLRAANAAATGAARWDDSAWSRLIETQIATPALPQVTRDPGFVPVFVIGLPRSGTTLLADQLGRYRGVRNAGESPWIAALYARLLALDKLQDARMLDSAAQLVAAQMRRDDAPVPGWVVDKNPLNFRYLNFIRALFPNAIVVHCRRDPRDTALSIWQQHFAHEDLAFAYDFETIARVTAGYRRLMQHWNATLRLPRIDVQYETLVAHADAELRRVAAFLQLPDAAPLSSHAGGAIATASVWQARQPIHARSVERWRAYAMAVPELERLFPDEPWR